MPPHKTRQLFTWLILLVLLAQPGLIAISGPLPENVIQDDDDLEVRVEAILEQMSVEERVGQVFMVSFVGQHANPDDDIAELIRDYKVGSVIYLEINNNIDNDAPGTPALVASLSNQLQRRAYEATYRESPAGDFFLPLFISIDHEGDESRLTRLRNGFTSIPSAMALGATWSTEDVEAVGAVVGQELAAVGINMLLGPVVDVLEKPQPEGSGDIGIRSFGGSAFWVGKLGRAYIRGVHQGGSGRVLTVAKHFPGHGASDRMPDNEVSTVYKSFEELRQSDLLPFFDVTRDDPQDPLGRTDGMMPSHIRYRGFQGDVSQLTRPISLDREGMEAFMALPQLAEWRREGLIVCDALGVSAIKGYYDPGLSVFPARQIAQDALMAGNDVLPLVDFSSNDEPGWSKGQFPTIKETITFFQQKYREDNSFRQRVDDAARHVLRAKLRLYPDLTLDSVLVTGTEPTDQGGAVVTEAARKALTLLYPQPQDLPHRLPAPPRFDENILIMGCFEYCLSDRLQADTVRDALLDLYGPQGSNAIDPERVHLVDFMQLYWLLTDELDESQTQTVTQLVQDADWIIFILVNYAPDVLPQTGSARLFLRDPRFDLRGKKVVALALHAPYYLDATEIGKLSAYFATYSKSDPSIQVALQALFQQASPGSAPPVSVEGISYDLQAALLPDQGLTLSLSDEVWHVGDAVRVRAGQLLDHNGHPVPDGARVIFRGDYTDLDLPPLAPSVVSDTVDGVAWAIFRPTFAGQLEISAHSEDVNSNSVVLLIEPQATAVPTAAPSPTQTAPAASAPSKGGSQLSLVPLLVILGALLVIGSLVLLRRRGRRPAPTTPPALPAPRHPPLAPRPSPLAPDDEGTISADLLAPTPALTGRTLSSCRVGRKLGEGGMGQVYQGYHPLLDRSVAIKVLPPSLLQSSEMRARFLQEARIAAALRHPNIVQVYDFGQEDDLVYMVMEYVAGLSLKERLNELRQGKQTMPVPQAVQIARQIAEALAYAHQQNAIHRDLKPANILLNEQGQAILVDFGLAVLRDGPRYTAPGKVWGSPSYIAPEQLDEPPSVDARSDVYSLGVVLYEMIANTPPFKSGSAMKILWEKVNLTPQPPGELVPGLPPALEAIILKALEQQPDARFATAWEMARALQQLGQGASFSSLTDF